MPFKTLEFHNLLIFSKLCNQSHLAFSDFQRFPTFWQILEGFSHTDSHTEIHASPARRSNSRHSICGMQTPFCRLEPHGHPCGRKLQKTRSSEDHLSGVPLSRQDSRSADQEAASGDGPQTAVHAEAGDELSSSRGSPVDELKRRSVTTGLALVGTTAPSGCQLPPVAAASVPVDAALASIFLFLLLLKRAAMIRRIGLVVALAVMWLPSGRANMGRGSWACSGPSISPVTLPRVLSS